MSKKSNSKAKPLLKKQEQQSKKVAIQTKNQKSQSVNNSSQNVKKPKITIPQPIPLTEQEVRQQKQKQQALSRLSKLQLISSQTQNKKSTLLLESIVKNIEKDIVQAHVQIPSEPHDVGKFILKKKQKEKQPNLLTESQSLDNQYRGLLSKKQALIEKMRQIQQSQTVLRKQLTESTLLSSSPKNKMPELTQQTKQHWQKIRQIVKEHQQNSKRIHELNQKKIEQEQRQQKQLQQRRNKQKSQEKRKSLEKRIQQIQKRSKQRTEHVKESHIIVDRLQKKTKLFQKMQQNWNKLEHEFKVMDEASMLESHIAKRLVSIRELKKYEKQHDQKFKEDQQRRKAKLSQSKITTEMKRFQRTKFSVDVLQQAKKHQKMEEQKLHEIKQLMNKRKQYASTVKQKFRSVSKLQKISQKNLQQPKLAKQPRSMTALDIRNKGNEYMRTINEGLNGFKQRTFSKKQIKSDTESSRVVYKNYLPQILKNNIKSTQVSRDMDMINTIMKKETTSTQQKFFQAQMITKKMQSGGTQKNILKSINAKIQILKKLSYNN